MDKQTVNQKSFNHPYLQTCVSFLGQTFNFAIYFFKSYQAKKKRENFQLQEDQQTNQSISEIQEGAMVKQGFPWVYLFLPSFFHGVCSITGYAAYFHMKASISMMLSGTLPVITAILTFLIFRKKILKHQKFGMLIILSGSVLLGFSAMQNEEPIEDANPFLGIIWTLISLIFFGFLMISEEYVLKKRKIEGTLVAGFEGLFALVIGISFIPILNFFQENLIDVDLFISQVQESKIVQFALFGLLFSDMLYTLFCILLTKYTNALTRSIIFQLRCIGVWFVALCLPNPHGQPGKDIAIKYQVDESQQEVKDQQFYDLKPSQESQIQNKNKDQKQKQNQEDEEDFDQEQQIGSSNSNRFTIE
ncbi:hypothetical protein PPERSA_00001 [Pseudocohnilembus persalinus]|uniref:EamA domain-containing protein n=1 Tax=Pseudocohnilembus persalinus TaxID=266149 RepID=A0A0V0QUR5_PSEPJ|nr:hypothetical protein PPERSA_00001 [Pseudocohnilembus persalinus]|eukprot:KRX06121.1 hypothetical protein PPERSA_00001 [Pseudocohnilembus persalinus]